MNNEKLFEAMENIDDCFIEEAKANKKIKHFPIKKIVALAACLAIIIAVGLPLALSHSAKVKTYDSLSLANELPIENVAACFVYDIFDPKAAAGFNDYVFLAKVEKELRTEYPTDTEMPRTVYSITVLQNIKGTLKTNAPIELYKQGGVNKIKTSISIFEDDEFLECGRYYIIGAVGQSDGSLLQSIGSLQELNASTEKQAMSDPTIELYKTYVKEEIPFERDRFISKYDENSENK